MINTKLTNNDFNDFFVTIPDTIVNYIEDTGYVATELLIFKNHLIRSFYIPLYTPQEVTSVVMSLKNTNSLDFYGINAAMLKETIDIIAAPLSNLFSACFDKGIFS